jgi:hypothetical protein
MVTAGIGNDGRHRVPKEERALAEDAPPSGDWAAVDRSVTERRAELRMSISYLARETGLSPTTIRYLGSPAGKHNKSTLVALSVVLGWPYKYLVNVLNGAPEKNTGNPGGSPREAYYENLLLAEVGPIREEMAELAAAVNGIGRKIDVMIQAGSDAGDADSGDAGDAGDAGAPADRRVDGRSGKWCPESHDAAGP